MVFKSRDFVLRKEHCKWIENSLNIVQQKTPLIISPPQIEIQIIEKENNHVKRAILKEFLNAILKKTSSLERSRKMKNAIACATSNQTSVAIMIFIFCAGAFTLFSFLMKDVHDYNQKENLEPHHNKTIPDDLTTPNDDDMTFAEVGYAVGLSIVITIICVLSVYYKRQFCESDNNAEPKIDEDELKQMNKLIRFLNCYIEGDNKIQELRETIPYDEFYKKTSEINENVKIIKDALNKDESISNLESTEEIESAEEGRIYIKEFTLTTSKIEDIMTQLKTLCEIENGKEIEIIIEKPQQELESYDNKLLKNGL